MANSLKDLGKSEHQIQTEEYQKLFSRLSKEDSFKTPQARSEAAARLKELRSILNARYLASRGLQ